MNEIGFLEAVGRVDMRLIIECITHTPSSTKKVVIRKIGAWVACFLMLFSAIILLNQIRQQTIINENGFYIENGILLRYSGAEVDITIPEEVNSIADFAFLHNPNSSNIQILRLGSNVKTIEINAFAGLENLIDIIIAANNLSFMKDNGLLMTSDGSILLRYERENEVLFNIPDTVRFVAAHAVQSTTLEEINFGENLEYIGYSAFAGNYFLKAIYLPESMKYIGDSAFSLCTAAVDGYIPKNVEIDGVAFYSVPFYLSQQSGGISPLEEVKRGNITPSEAIIKSDLYSLSQQLDFLYASMRGEEYEANEQALLGYAAIHNLPSVPKDLSVPESVDLNNLVYADKGWGKTGIYDITISVPAGEYTILIEAYAYGIENALYWSDVRFRLVNVYYLLNNLEDSNTEDTITYLDWTVVFDKDGDLYSGITYIHKDCSIIRSALNIQSFSPYKLIFSPEGTRVAVEYISNNTTEFYIQSLNGDKITYNRYEYNEYSNRYYGAYQSGSLYWIDEDNIGGINEYGPFELNIYEKKITQEYNDTQLIDPENRNIVCVTVDVFEYNITFEIPETWVCRGSYYDLVRENQGLDAHRMTMPMNIPRNKLMTNGEWTPEKLQGTGWVILPYEDDPGTEITHGTTNGIKYIVLEQEIIGEFPSTMYTVAIAYDDMVQYDFRIITYPEDGENAFERIVMTIINSIIVNKKES